MKITPSKEFTAIKIRSKYARAMEELVKPYTERERETWAIQVKEADLWLNDQNSIVPLISTIAASRGVSLSDLVLWIKANESAYRIAIGDLLGKQQKELDLLYSL